MNNEINYKNNPLNGIGLKNLLIEIVDHYSFEILFAYLNINCFKTNPSIDSSVKFLKKTVWAREKVEAFYLYQFKNLPKASSTQFLLPPRERIIPDEQKPGEPAVLSLEDAELLREKRAKKAAEWSPGAGQRMAASKPYGNQFDEHSTHRNNNRARKEDCESPGSPNAAGEDSSDPWANWKRKSKG